MKDVIKAIFGWFVAVVIIILIVWIPREFSFERTEYEIFPAYTFSSELYKENLVEYGKLVFEDRSLGENRFGKPVTDDIKTYFSRSMVIITFAFFTAIIFGTLKGFLDYRLKESKWNFIGNNTTFLFQSMPDFFVVIIFQIIMLNLMSKGFPHIKIYGVDSWQNFLIAGCFLSIFPTIYFTRIVFSALTKEEGLPYLLTVKSKGMSNFTLLWKHQFGNSVFQVVPHIPTIMLYIISNLLIIEYLMYFRGAGYRLYEALGFAGATLSGRNRTPFSINVYEPELVIAISAVFIAFVVFVQLVCKIWIYFSPLWNGGDQVE
ncbi:ABC transporter permease subunit [Bacillaceae bacterium IKA-2]|nr:ABC transporter permease subunit [Bacillaceae bacterium IKA-2]